MSTHYQSGIINLNALDAVATLLNTIPSALSEQSKFDVPDKMFIQLSGTFTATLLFEGGVAGSSSFFPMLTQTATGTFVTQATAPGLFIVEHPPPMCRVRANPFTSGPAVVIFGKVYN